MQKASTNSAPHVHHAFWYDDVFLELAYGEQGEQARLFINTPRYTVKDSGATYRVINSWAAQKLLPERREDGEATWRKLTLKDLIWLEIIKELREFGLSLEKIRKTFHSLVLSEGEHIERAHLEVALGLAIRENPIAVFVLVFEDGTADIATEDCIDFNDHMNGYQTFLRVNINQLLLRIFPKTRLVRAAWRRVPLSPHDNPLDNAEQAVVKALRDKENEKILVRKRDGEIDSLETTANVPKAQAFEMLREMQYGEVSIKKENGASVNARVTRRSKVKK